MDILAAVALELSIGMTRTQEPTNNLWYQEEFAHTLNLESPTYSVGVVYDGWRIGYSHMGTYSSKALASPDDHNYFAWREGKEELWPLAEFNGKGWSQGIHAMKRVASKNGFYLDVGAYAHRNKWTMVVIDWRPSRDRDPVNIYVSGSSTAIGGVVVAGYDFGGLSAEYKITQIEGGDTKYPPIFKGFAHTMQITYRF